MRGLALVAGALLGALQPAPLDAQLTGRPPSLDQMATWAGPGGDPARLHEAVLAHLAEESTGESGALWVHLLSVVAEVQPGSAERAVRAVALGLDDEGLEGAELLMSGAGGTPAAERPALMSLAARLADREDAARGAEIRRALISAHPDAHEAAEARLRRARFLLDEEDSAAEGLALLEELIVNDPEHPMAPEARRLFQENGGRGRPSATPTSGAPL